MTKLKKRSWRKVPVLVRRTGLAASPGTIAPSPDAIPPKLHVIAYGPEQLDECDVPDVEALRSIRAASSGVLWVNIEGVGDAPTFKALGELFGLHPLALEDAVHLHQRSKAEDYEDHAYVVLQAPAGDEMASLEQVSIFFGADYVITIHKSLSGDRLDPLRQRIRSARGRIRKRGADYLAYAVMDAIMDSYFPVVETLNERLERFEDQVIHPDGDEVVASLHEVRHELHMLRRVLVSSREAFALLVRGETGPVAESTIPFLRDCHDHTEQLLDAVEALRELLTGLMDLYLAGMSNRMNEVMKVLTIIATIFIPLSFIAGIYGMNFDPGISSWNMPELGWRLGYPFALVLMLGTTITFLIYFRQRGWLGRPRRNKAHRDPGDSST